MGHNRSSNEIVIGAPEGVVKAYGGKENARRRKMGWIIDSETPRNTPKNRSQQVW